MRRAGFTLIEIMIVVGIIAIMLASAVMSVASGRGAVQVKEATRGVIQLSRYASALALLRQRPVVVTFHHNGKIEVRISGEATGSDAAGSPSDPIYREVDGKTTLTAAEYSAETEDEADESSTQRGSTATAGEGGSAASAAPDEKKGYFYSKRVLDPEVLAKEDTEGQYEGVTFTVEVLGEDGEPLDRDLAAARSLRQPKRERKDADGEIVEEEPEEETEPPVSVTYETNGNVNPHRIIVRLAGESEAEEGFAINISRSGKATVGDDEEEGRNVRRRRRR
jgi:prepilin-type N-terminal cleavage/methylation domain-containing protein